MCVIWSQGSNKSMTCQAVVRYSERLAGHLTLRVPVVFSFVAELVAEHRKPCLVASDVTDSVRHVLGGRVGLASAFGPAGPVGRCGGVISVSLFFLALWPGVVYKKKRPSRDCYLARAVGFF